MDFFASLEARMIDILGPMGPVIVMGLLGLLIILGALPFMSTRRADPIDRLKNEVSRKSAAREPAQAALRPSDYSDKLQRFAHFLEPTKVEELTAGKLRLMRAGYRAKNAIRTFHFAQFALAITFLIIGVGYTFLTMEEKQPSTTFIILQTIMPAALGYYLPSYWIERRVQTRREEMICGFPDSLDMMLVCVEAGQSLDQAIIRVAKEIKLGYPALGEEYEIVAHEVKAGKDRSQVLRDFGERAGVSDIASFVTTMVQSATYGTSIAESLRIYASEMRDKRVMRAEEKANVLPTKLTLGTMMFTVPPLLIILIGPSVYGIAKTLGGGGGF